MPKFHVVCRKEYYTDRTTLVVRARSAGHARRKVEDSRDPLIEFEDLGPFDQPEIEVTVEAVRAAEESRKSGVKP